MLAREEKDKGDIMSISEPTLQNWAKAPNCEKAKHTHEMIRKLIGNYQFDGKTIDTFLQGSYRNSTNITKDSDVDIVAYNDGSFFSNKESMGKDFLEVHNREFSNATYGFDRYKNELYDVLCKELGSDNVKYGEKCIKIKGNTSRLNSDVIPCVQYRYYTDKNDFEKYHSGIGLKTKNSEIIANFPKQHIENTEEKNKNTNGYFKSAVRVFKNIRNYLGENDIIDADTIPSYYLECLLWNVNTVFFSANSWCERILQILHALVYLLKNDEAENRVVQANNIYKLFHTKFWNLKEAKIFVDKTVKAI